MGFRLYSIKTDNHNLPLVDFNHNDDNSNYISLLIGNNGTGKSTILSTIARHFKDVFKYRYATQDTLFPERFNYKIIPSKVIATTHSISDKFPNDDTYSNRSDITTIDFDSNRYLYLGARNKFNGFSSKALINKSMDIVLEQYLKSEVSAIYKHIFDYLGFEPILKIEYKINNRIRSVIDIKSEIQNRILPRSNKYINVDVIEYIENNIDRIIEFLVSHESNRDSIVINFSSKNIDRISQNGSIYSEQYETYNIINILRKIEIITGYDIVVYKKNGNKFNLTNASSGELCILSTFLGLIPMLKDNCLVLIDEPEISLHPLWQSKYIDLVSKIFSYFRGCHIIIATHSHFLVTDLVPKKSSVVVLKNDGKTIIGDLLLEPTYGWSAEDILLDVFKTPSTRNYYLSQRISRMLELIADKQNETEEYRQLRKQVIPFYDVLKDTDPLKDIIALLKDK